MELLINEGNKDPAATSQIDSSLAAWGRIPASVHVQHTRPDVLSREILSSGIFYTGRLDCEWMVLAQ